MSSNNSILNAYFSATNTYTSSSLPSSSPASSLVALNIQTLIYSKPNGTGGGSAAAFTGGYFSLLMNEGLPALADVSKPIFPAGGVSTTIPNLSLGPDAVDSNSKQLPTGLFQLLPGTYRLHASCPGFNVGNMRCALWNSTTSSMIIYGTSSYSGSGNVIATSDFDTVLTVTAPQIFALVFQCSYPASTTNDLGAPCGYGSNEYYATLTVTQLA